MLAFATALLSLASLVVAQNATIQVQVGGEASSPGGIFQFIPPTINATVGSTITFNFSGSPGNHTVAQSSFSDPCNQLSNGFSSGFVFVPPNSTTGFPTFNLTVESADPIYFYCAQTAPSPHCFAGMVGGINVAPSNFASFQAAATSLQAAFIASTTLPGVPTGALSGSGAAASVGPGPFTGSFSGANTPTGSLSVSVASTSGGASSTRSSAAASVRPGALHRLPLRVCSFDFKRSVVDVGRIEHEWRFRAVADEFTEQREDGFGGELGSGARGSGGG
ncbi:hypothetical protein EIP91_011514, partial [Steccherinum ochraceum]